MTSNSFFVFFCPRSSVEKQQRVLSSSFAFLHRPQQGPSPSGRQHARTAPAEDRGGGAHRTRRPWGMAASPQPSRRSICCLWRRSGGAYGPPRRPRRAGYHLNSRAAQWRAVSPGLRRRHGNPLSSAGVRQTWHGHRTGAGGMLICARLVTAAGSQAVLPGRITVADGVASSSSRSCQAADQELGL